MKDDKTDNNEKMNLILSENKKLKRRNTVLFLFVLFTFIIELYNLIYNLIEHK